MALLPPSDLISLCGEEAFCLCWLAVVLSGLALAIPILVQSLSRSPTQLGPSLRWLLAFFAKNASLGLIEDANIRLPWLALTRKALKIELFIT